jgi:hypothetical protein
MAAKNHTTMCRAQQQRLTEHSKALTTVARTVIAVAVAVEAVVEDY